MILQSFAKHSEVWHPHDYQRRAVEFMLTSGSGQIWMSPGMGKSAITLQTIKTLHDVGAVKKVLIICPLRPAYAVWPAEIKKWQNFNGMTISVLHDAQKDRLFDDDSMIHVINFEGLQWLQRRLLHSKKPFPYDMLVVDEISYLKNTRSVRFKTLSLFLDKFKRRYGLTGSPASNSLLDVFGPQLVIDRGATFGKFITHFKNKYFYPSGYGGYTWTLQQGAEEAIYAALADKVLRMKSQDYLTLPELMYNRVEIDLPPTARALYDEMERNLLIQLRENVVTAANAAVAIAKCQQLANGGIYLDGVERESKIVHDAKTEATQDIVEELNGQPVLIGYHFKHDYARLMKAFPHAKHIGSGVTGTELNNIIDDWNAGRVQVLLAHPQSAGHGLNLQGSKCSTVIWYSNTWSLELFEQFIGRVWRQGCKSETVIVHQVIATNTVDEAIVDAIHRKDRTQQALMNAVQRYAEERS